MTGSDPVTTRRGRRVWLLDHAPILGGAELFALKLARHAAVRTDLDVVLLCPPGSELAARARADALDVREVGMAHFAAPAQAPLIPLAVARLVRVLRRAPAGTVFVANTAWAQALLSACAPWLRGRRIVHLLHEQDTAARRSARLVLSRVGRPVAIGANAARTYRAALGHDVAQVDNVLDDAELAAAAGAPHRVQPADRAGAPPVVGVLARLIAEKGVAELVDELAACPHAWSTARLAGPAQHADYETVVRERIAAHGLGDRIGLEGRREAAAFIDAIDVLVVPSTGTEGQPTVALEALARGVPVVLRAAVHSPDYAGLPVAVYHDASDLGAALERLPAEPAPLAEIARRFGAGQALDGLLRAGHEGTPCTSA